jgi:putative CRISPR-associated protein (TIGR02620 family)
MRHEADLKENEMSIWYVGRHEASSHWLLEQGIALTHCLPHLDGKVWPVSGDVVIGNLPIQWVAELSSRGVKYVHIELTLPLSARGQELTADDLSRYGVKLTAYSAAKSELPSELSRTVKS